MKKLVGGFSIFALLILAGQIHAQNPEKVGQLEAEPGSKYTEAQRLQMKAETKAKVNALPNNTKAPAIVPFVAVSPEKMKARQDAQNRAQQGR